MSAQRGANPPLELFGSPEVLLRDGQDAPTLLGDRGVPPLISRPVGPARMVKVAVRLQGEPLRRVGDVDGMARDDELWLTPEPHALKERLQVVLERALGGG